MNRIYRSIWNAGAFVAASENAHNAGKSSLSGVRALSGEARFALNTLALSVLLAFSSAGYAAPTGGAVAAGTASIATTGGKTTINQTSQKAAINWQGFSIGAGEAVVFVQPNSSSVALNRVLGPDPSSVFGSLSANGKVFLVNPNGVLFGQGAQVSVGGLVASTLHISDSDFMAGSYRFSGSGHGSVVNQGAITADGGYVALLGAKVSNEGLISAQLGTVALAAGKAITLDVAGDGLLNVAVNEGAVSALVHNGGLIRADGGQVLLTAQSAGNLLQTVVNNTGVVQAQTIDKRDGTILLLGDMQSGTVTVGGTLDASAPKGGDGGFIETSAARVSVRADAKVTTAASTGLTGTWLIDPQDFTVGSGATDNISGFNLSVLLNTNSVIISTATGADVVVAGTPPVSNLHTATAGNGDIHVNEAVSWTAAPIAPTTLTLNAVRDVNINAAVSATNGNLVACCGRDVNVNAAVTTSNGSVLLSAGRDVKIAAAMTTTNGNVQICAGNDINVAAKLTLTDGNPLSAQSLGMPLGLVLTAGTGGSGPGLAGGTVTFAPLAPAATVTGPNAPVTVTYNPVAYTAPTDYLLNFILSGDAALTQHMLVFPDGADKTFDGTNTAVLTSLKGNPANVSLVAGAGSTAFFDSAQVGVARPVSFTGYTLAGPDAAQYALPIACCAPVVGKTTATITPAPIVVVPPVVVAPVLVPVVSPEAEGVERRDTPQFLLTPALLPVPERVNLAVIGSGVRMPPLQVAPAPLPPAAAPAAVIVPTPQPAPVYVAPVRPRKADRN